MSRVENPNDIRLFPVDDWRVVLRCKLDASNDAETNDWYVDTTTGTSISWLRTEGADRDGVDKDAKRNPDAPGRASRPCPAALSVSTGSIGKSQSHGVAFQSV